MTRQYRTFQEMKVSHFRNHPEDLSSYLAISFEESKKDGDWSTFLVALRTAVETKGSMTDLANALGRSRPSLYKTLNENATPQLESIEAILEHLGCELSIRPLAKEKVK